MSPSRFPISPVNSLVVSLIFALCAALPCSAEPAGFNVNAAPPPAGTIDLIGGDVQIIQTGKQSRRAAVGDPVNEGDTLVTGKDSEAHITMQDSGFMALRPNTRLKIVSYTADGGDDDKGVFRLFVGGLRSITGWIGKYNRKSYQIRTATATIGIRGTDHETRYIPPGSPDGEPGTYDKVFTGETSIQTQAGQADVNADRVGYVPDTSGQQPRVLPRIPAFFRPGPHEDIINNKHAEIQKIIEQRREERRKIVAEKRAALDASRAEMKAQVEQNKAANEERKTAAEELHQGTEEQLAALRTRGEALQKKQKTIQDMRKSIQQQIGPDLAKNPDLRRQLKQVRETGKEIREGYKEIQDARKALNDSNAAATEARKADTEAQRLRSEQQFAALSEQAKNLQEKQKTNQQMRESMQAKNTPEQRKALRDASDSADKDQRELLEAQNTLFENNIAASEARMRAAQALQKHSEEQLAALNEKEDALQTRQKINEETLESIQQSGAQQTGNTQVQDLLGNMHDAIEAARQERKEIQDARRALHQKNTIAIAERQQAALDQLAAIREKHRDVHEKSIDLQNERESMQEEIRSLYEQEQKRYREELKADRQQAAMQETLAD